MHMLQLPKWPRGATWASGMQPWPRHSTVKGAEPKQTKLIPLSAQLRADPEAPWLRRGGCSVLPQQKFVPEEYLYLSLDYLLLRAE